MAEWRVVPSYPWLEASSDGRLRSRLKGLNNWKAGREIVGSKNKQGYITVTVQFGEVRKCNFGKHILICEAFHGPKPSPTHQVAHWNGIRDHNWANNLRWVTPKENAFDRIRHGSQSGSNHPAAILQEADVITIRHLKSLGYSTYDIALLFEMRQTTIARIAAGKTWSTTFADAAANAPLSFGG